MADFLAKLIYALLKLIGEDIADYYKRTRMVKEAGDKAETDSQESVSELLQDAEVDFGTPDQPAPIKEGSHVPTTDQASDFLKSRRDRKRP